MTQQQSGSLSIAITGANGFIGRNLSVRLGELGHEILPITRDTEDEDWAGIVGRADAIVHLAGANRPVEQSEFMEVNAGTAQLLADAVRQNGRSIPVVYASSSKAGDDNEYGRSKRSGEDVLLELNAQNQAAVYVFRFPNVFGKWARPNYNSAVATFCHNIARDIPISIHDKSAPLSLIYIDDVMQLIVDAIAGEFAPGFVELSPVYETTVGAVADAIASFKDDRNDNLIAPVGTGLTRALYATYLAALPPHSFSYEIQSYVDPRGAFSEILKTRDSGQFSYFTALPGITRGGHYHHTKTEKFLIVHGRARFGFRHIDTGETHEIFTDHETPTVVETVPGWTHDVTNIGDDTMIAMLWANEIFDRDKPDTIAAEV